MRVEVLTKQDYQRYEEFIGSFKKSLFYYSIKYKELLEELLEVKSHYLLVLDDKSNIKAVLPLMIKQAKYGSVLNSLPYYGGNGGILADSKDDYDFLLDYYYKFRKNFSSATYVSNPLVKNQLDIQSDIVDDRIGQFTSIDYNENIEDNIMKSFDSSARRNIKKALNSGVEVDIQNDSIEFLYQTHYENITSINGKAKDKSFFQLMQKYFLKGKDYNIYIAKVDKKEVAALLVFYYNETVEYFTPATLKQYRNIQPLSLLIYTAMCDASKKAYKWWNWGGTWRTQEGVYKFKKKFGAVDKIYKYYIDINNTEIYKATKEELLKEYDNFYVIPFDKLQEDMC